MARYAALLSVELPQIYLLSSFEDSSPCAFIAELNATVEYYADAHIGAIARTRRVLHKLVFALQSLIPTDQVSRKKHLLTFLFPRRNFERHIKITLFVRPSVRPFVRYKLCLSDKIRTSEANLMKLHRKMKQK